MPRSRSTTVSAQDLERAARVLAVRSRREASGLFAGNYASAFRGGGLEFEESRPYAAGDDVRTIDWNATARVGEPFVKLFREERDQTVLFGLDVSGSMAFGTTGSSDKARTAAHALALMAAAAGRAGDRTGLVAFDDAVRRQVPVTRGSANSGRVIHAAVEAAAASSGRTDLGVGLRALRKQARRRAVLILISDFRDAELLPASGPPRLGAELGDLAQRHDLVAAVVSDPREASLPRAGTVRVADSERPGATLVLATGSRRVRARYRAACAARRRRLEGELRRSGADIVWLTTDRSPLYGLARFFQERAGRRLRAVA